MSIAMSDEFTSFDQRAVIKVCGVGGGGGNAVARMIEAGLSDVEFIAINTDAQALKQSPAGTRLQIGAKITGGLGSGARPDIGEKAAMEDQERIGEVLGGADMVFLTGGLGGGTGTGAGPIVAQLAKKGDALVVAIVTLPFAFEGAERMENALKGLHGLEKFVDTLIIVPNERLAALCQGAVTFLNAFRMADEVLHNGVRAISELITVPGLINVDFADVRTIMVNKGRALMGIGRAEGEDRAVQAAKEAIVCPLLEQSNIEGAKGVIVNVKGGCDVGMREIQTALTTVKDAAHPQANIIFGAVVDEEERPELQVTVIAAGFHSAEKLKADHQVRRPVELHVVETPEPPKKDPSPPQKAAKADVKREAPGVQYLFPETEQDGAGESAPSEEGVDIDIPTFMRRRKSKT